VSRSHVPEGYAAVTPYLVVPDVERLIEFVTTVLDAEVRVAPLRRDDGSIMHAEVSIGDSRVMMGEPRGDSPPKPAMLYVYVDDADDRYRRALAAGATSLMEPSDEPHGDRYGGVRDSQGNEWYMAHVLRQMTDSEVREAYGEGGGAD
jgi:PhnB protein